MNWIIKLLVGFVAWSIACFGLLEFWWSRYSGTPIEVGAGFVVFFVLLISMIVVGAWIVVAYEKDKHKD